MMQAARIVTSWKDGKMRILCPGFTGGNALTTGISLLSLSDKSAVDVVGNLDLDVDCAAGSYFALRAPSRRVWWVDFGLWNDGAGCGVCCYDCPSGVD